MIVSQTSFHDALFDRATPVPMGLQDGQGLPAGRRFNVYRNTVAVSLTEALELGFPAVRSLIGDENFRKLAGLFLRRTPPSTPLMMLYGKEFPEFLESFAPLSDIRYLGDVARLEQAQREAYHAADAKPVAPEALAGLAPDALAHSRFRLAPAIRLIRSVWPVHDIWRFATQKGAAKPAARAQDVLVTRPDYDPELHVLPEGGAAFLGAIQTGATLTKACEAGEIETEAFDLAAMLGLLLQTGAIIAVTPED